MSGGGPEVVTAAVVASSADLKMSRLQPPAKNRGPFSQPLFGDPNIMFRFGTARHISAPHLVIHPTASPSRFRMTHLSPLAPYPGPTLT
ncbi:unnamed protein product [Gadus morhua 'NCC']